MSTKDNNTEEKKIEGQQTEEQQTEKQQTEKQQTEEQKKEEQQIRDQKSDKKKHPLIVAIALLLISMLVLAYFGGAYYYERHFLPNTIVNGLSFDNLTVEEASLLFQQWYEDNYSLKLVDRDGKEVATVSPRDVGMMFTNEESIEELLKPQNVYCWPLRFLSEDATVYEISSTVLYDQDALRDTLKQAGLFEPSAGVEPQNAYISEYLEDKKQYEMIPEKEGTLLVEELTLLHAGEAITRMDAVLNLEDAKCYEQPEITSDNEQLQERLEALNKLVGTCITYDWNGSEEIVDGDLIHDWLIFDGDEILLDEEQIAAYVAEKAKQYDTYGKKRNFLTTLGAEVTLPSGAYGWKTDKEAETAALTELILEGVVTDREPEYSCKGWAKGSNDIGNSYVEVDLTGQHLYLYEDGKLVLETDFVSGNMSNGCGTPAGVFGITYKTTNAVLRGDDYETPVSYWMPFNGNIGMHDATWRRSFGGDIYLTRGSHGCINLPLDMAAAIYGYVSKGFPVVCYY
ncbi:MAG: L,D-transpeptidase family protein [Lachnospiraceae bacterium]